MGRWGRGQSRLACAGRQEAGRAPFRKHPSALVPQPRPLQAPPPPHPTHLQRAVAALQRGLPLEQPPKVGGGHRHEAAHAKHVAQDGGGVLVGAAVPPAGGGVGVGVVHWAATGGGLSLQCTPRPTSPLLPSLVCATCAGTTNAASWRCHSLELVGVEERVHRRHHQLARQVGQARGQLGSVFAHARLWVGGEGGRGRLGR